MHFGVAPFMETFILVQFLFFSVAWIDGGCCRRGTELHPGGGLSQNLGRSTMINQEFGEIDFLVGGLEHFLFSPNDPI